MREYRFGDRTTTQHPAHAYRCECMTASGTRCKRYAAEYRRTTFAVVAACWQHLDASYPTPYWTTDE